MCFAEEFISLSSVLFSYSYNFLVICHKILNRILVAPVHIGFILHPFLERITTELWFRLGIYFIIIVPCRIFLYFYCHLPRKFKYFQIENLFSPVPAASTFQATVRPQSWFYSKFILKTYNDQNMFLYWISLSFLLVSYSYSFVVICQEF